MYPIRFHHWDCVGLAFRTEKQICLFQVDVDVEKWCKVNALYTYPFLIAIWAYTELILLSCVL